jgi:hypothetical protein
VIPVTAVITGPRPAVLPVRSDGPVLRRPSADRSGRPAANLSATVDRPRTRAARSWPLLVLAAPAGGATRTRTFLAAKYHRLCRHMPKKKAQIAIMRTQLTVAHALLSDPEAAYHDPGPGYYEQRQDTRRLTHGHIRSLEHLGWKVTLEPIDPATGELTSRTAS